MSEERPNPVPGGDASGPPPADPGPTPAGAPGGPTPRLVGGRPRPGAALQKPPPEPAFTPEQRLLILDAWRRSGLPAGDFAPLVGLSKHTLYAWKKKFDDQGPALPASPSAVARVLHEEGYEGVETATTPHEPKVTSFERARPNQLWQTD